MKKTNLVVKMSLAALMAGSVGTATADLIDGTATANVIAPLTVVETVGLNFGTVAGGAGTGTVEIDSTGTETVLGDASYISGTGNRATFDISGAASTNIAVTLGNTGGIILDGPGAAMTVDNFSNSALPTATDIGGAAQFFVGGRLNINATQATGTYDTATGTGAPYTVTVNYN